MKKAALCTMFIAFILQAPSLVVAARPTCDLLAIGTQLKTVSSESQSQTQELDLRKSLLTATIDCAINETSDLQEKIITLELAEPTMANLKSQLENKMTQALTYYENQQSMIGDLGIQGTKQFARDIALWRTQNYLPDSDAINNFILWNTNQELFKKAANRFAQVRNTVASLKLVDNEEIQSIFRTSSEAMAHAQELNGLAKEAIMRYPLITDTSTPLKASLEALAGTYQTFFDLSSAIDKILPH